MSNFELHSRLRDDCHQLGRLSACHLLLHRNSAVPWFILVPETDVIELFELESSLRQRVSRECDAVARFLRSEMGARKTNVAAIGNLAPQLHIHVVGRSPDDPCWPAPVWGNLPHGGGYSNERLAQLQSRLVSSLDLRAEPGAGE
jgi:diadenosine tetraphosphate (Ap4A) HIT family hydrolase